MPSSHTSINLLIVREKDSPQFRKIKKVLPLSAAVTVGIFLIIFIISFIYTNVTLNRFNSLKREVESYEKKISDQKKTEQSYTISVKRLDTIQNILGNYTEISPLMTQITNLGTDGMTITASSMDTKGNVNILVSLSSADTLVHFIDSILSKEENDKLFSQIEAHGIVRDKKGNYVLSLILKSKIPTNT